MTDKSKSKTITINVHTTLSNDAFELSNAAWTDAIANLVTKETGVIVNQVSSKELEVRSVDVEYNEPPKQPKPKKKKP